MNIFVLFLNRGGRLGLSHVAAAALLLLLIACKGELGKEDVSKQAVESKVWLPSLIYGSDDRLDYFQANTQLQGLARSTVALMKATQLNEQTQGRLQISAKSLRDSHGVCGTEPFATQPTAAFCSGTLVAKDLILTAGHCLSSASDCNNVRFVFDYNVKSAGAHPTSVDAGVVYRCKEILHTQAVGSGADFAIVRLDRAVVGAAPLPMRRSGVAAAGDSLVVIGHPVGLPTKIAGGAKVRSVASDYFVANLDTYGGNSGSAVFNASTGVIEGVLVRGDADFVFSGGCQVSRRCADEACRGEDVTRIDRVLERFPLAELPSAGDTQPTRDEIFVASANRAIPDNNVTGIKSSIVATSAPQGRALQVKVQITHPYRGDLVLSLVAPDGREVLLLNRQGGSADNVNGTFGADLNSVSSLTALSTVSMPGTWSLKVSDRARQDVGKLVQWSLVFKAGKASN